MEKVLIRKIENYDVDLLTEEIGNIFCALPNAALLCRDTKVVLKPNLLAKHAPEAAVTTHPAVVEAVIIELKKRGVRDITLIDSAGGLYNEKAMLPIYRACGMLELCKRYEVACSEDYSTVKMKSGGTTCSEFTVLTPIANADFIINLPKLKTHAMTGMTCAVKNLFGVVSGLLKAELHMRFPDKELFGAMLTELACMIKPDITIVDAVTAMEGDGPAGGIPRHCGHIFAGQNPFNIDLVCAKYIGIDETAVPYLAAAQKMKICKTFSSSLIFDGDTLESARDYRLPSSYGGILFEKHMPKFMRPLMPKIGAAIAPRPVIKRAECIGCNKCGVICPADTIKIENGVATIYKKDCIRCFCCHEVCPVKAIDIKKLGVFNA